MSKGQGFASLSPEDRKRIASMGGKKLSENRLHMAEIGRKGGERSKIKKVDNQTENAATS